MSIPISHTDLMLNPDGSVYHLHLVPDDLADTVLLVGDPGRVRQVSSRFDHIELKKSNREFVTHTGVCRGKRLTVISTGIGTDNIDIVLNELDALVNIDLKSRQIKHEHNSLNLIRMGTSGALHAHIEPGSTIMAKVAGGFDGLYHFYNDRDQITVPGIAAAFMGFTHWKSSLADPYFVAASGKLLEIFSTSGQVSGITLSTPGFYAPQVRSIRLSPFDDNLIQKIGAFSFNDMQINNFEMESSALYALSALLGHHAVTMCVAIANRITGEFLEDYKAAVDSLIGMVIHKLTRE